MNPAINDLAERLVQGYATLGHRTWLWRFWCECVLTKWRQDGHYRTDAESAYELFDALISPPTF
jgi:hypothetical protein